MIKKYYIIEPLDIDGDKNPDGFLISQYKIDKNNNKIFIKNKYVRYSKLNSYIKKGGSTSPKLKTNQNLIVLTPEQFNAFMNNKSNNPPGNYQNNPPPVIIRDNNTGSFGNSLISGFAGGLGFSIGSEVVDSIFGE